MSNSQLGGVTALITKYFPTNEDGEFHEPDYRNHIRWLVEKGVHTIGVNAGADFDYSDAMRRRVAEILVNEVDGEIPVCMGASAWDTATAVKRAKEVEEIGLDAVFMTGPPKDPPYEDNSIESQPYDGIVDHYRQVSEAVDIPIFFYNTPGADPGTMSPVMLKKIEKKAPNVEYVKAGSYSLNQFKETADGLADSDLKIITGKSYYNFHMLNYAWNRNRPAGLTGYLPGILPAEHVEMWEAFQEGDVDRARDVWQSKILPLADLLYGRAFGYNEKLAPMEVLKQMGVIKNARIPFSAADIDEYAKKEIGKFIHDVQPDV
jgi:4-hydroxy-tetrahydrodipicolinate synthase